MKIFISWSGKPSHNIALALKDWLPLLFTGIELFVSSEDIRKGKRWRLAIAKELESSDFGIVCLTPDNTEAPWLLFESGALSKSLKESSVSTLLTGGLRAGDVEGPLSDFQHTNFEKEDFFKLVTSINEGQPKGKHDLLRLRKVFDKFWDELVSNVEKALKSVEQPEKKRSVEDMVRELLELTTQIAKSIPEPSLARRYLATPSSSFSGFAENQKFAEIWDEALNRLGSSRLEIADLLLDVSFKYSGGELLLNFPRFSALKRFDDAKGADSLRHVLDEISPLPVTSLTAR